MQQELQKKKKIKVISLIGKTGGELKSISDHYIIDVLPEEVETKVSV